MNAKEFTEWSERFPGIVSAMKDVGGTCELIEEISVKLIDFEFMATIPINMYSCFVSPEIYVVWSDGQTDDILVKEIYSSISQREELIDFVSWQEEAVSCPITIEQPIATYFKKRYDVKYLIVVMRSGGSEIENFKITIYHLPRGF